MPNRSACGQSRDTANADSDLSGGCSSSPLASSHRYSDQVAQQIYVLLKKDVDTIAVNAAAGLNQTAQRLVELADDKEPQNGTAANP